MRRKDSFFHFFQLISVVQLDGVLTAMDKLGPTTFVAGDSEGKIYVLSSSGDSLAELDTGLPSIKIKRSLDLVGTHSPVIDVASYQISTTKTAAVTIHSDGRLGIHVMYILVVISLI